MNILYIYAHPNPKSFNAVLKNAALTFLNESQHNVIVSDLYQEQFNPVASWDDFTCDKKELNQQYFFAQQQAYQNNWLHLDITTQISNIKKADHLIFQFPLWWFHAPAILKGWFDKILLKGFAYDSGKIFENGLLKGKTASLTVTTQSNEAAYQIDGLHGATLDNFLLPIYHTLKFVGIACKPSFAAYGMFDIDDERKKIVLTNYQQYLNSIMKTIQSA